MEFDMADQETLFDLPNAPEAFGIVLQPSRLRRIDFSGLDFDTARRAIIEYIQTYFPDKFNDFVASNGIMMLTEIVASVVAKLSLRADVLANEATLPTASTERAVINHLALINQRIRRQTPAVTDIEISVDLSVGSDIEIDPGFSFSTTNGPDGQPITYEVFRAPGDWTSKIIIPAGKRGVIAWGVEGTLSGPVNVTSSGGPGQTFEISDVNILESPMFVDVRYGNSSEEWLVITEPIERYGPNDKVVEVNFFEDVAVFRFGDDVTGASPKSGSIISFRYRVGGGVRGRISTGQIDSQLQISPNPPSNAAVSVRFRNVSPSSGGTDRESVAAAKRRAPRDFAIQRSIVTANDYAQAANSFSHPVYGAISKSVATIRTGLNANLVEIYALSTGPDNTPVIPNAGLKAGLETYFSTLNVMTDHVRVLDGKIKPVDINMNVIVDRNADASVVKSRVESAINEFFDTSNWEMGQGLYISNIIEAVEAIDGIAYVDLFEPSNNVLPTSEDDGVRFNELIVQGKRRTSYYYATLPLSETRK
jgi:uncharacterized phage protein gp47/JayE